MDASPPRLPLLVSDRKPQDQRSVSGWGEGEKGQEYRARTTRREKRRVKERWKAECRGGKPQQSPAWCKLWQSPQGQQERAYGVLLAPHIPGSHTPAPGLRHCQEKEDTVPSLLPSLFGSLFFFHSHSALFLFPKAGVWRPHPETIFQKTRQGQGF